VAGFIGSPQMNFVPVRLVERGDAGATVELPGAARVVLPLDARAFAPGTPLTLGVRPEHLAPADAGALALGVDLVEQLGGISHLHGRLADGTTRAIVSLPGQTSARSGESLRLDVPADNAHLFAEDGAALPRLRARP
jgi:multiple sugar transport system ATP-binding protein